MTETHQRGGKAYHSVLAPHSDFIRELRQRRKTWQEIADLLHTEKGIRVTLYAPYHFYRRKLKRAKRPHWESETAPVESQPTRPIVPASRPGDSAPAPLPAQPAFKRPNRETFNRDEFT
jgi:hypothetical protein